jgi:hypothetical protein
VLRVCAYEKSVNNAQGDFGDFNNAHVILFVISMFKTFYFSGPLMIAPRSNVWMFILSLQQAIDTFRSMFLQRCTPFFAVYLLEGSVPHIQ